LQIPGDEEGGRTTNGHICFPTGGTNVNAQDAINHPPCPSTSVEQPRNDIFRDQSIHFPNNQFQHASVENPIMDWTD